jgi:hypothetical protein
MADETQDQNTSEVPPPEAKTEHSAPGAPQPEQAADQAPSWEYRKNMKITERLINIVNLSKDVTQAEIARLRKKIDKLTYGS